MTLEDLKKQFSPGITFTCHRPIGKFGVLAVVAYDQEGGRGCRYECLEKDSDGFFEMIEKHVERNLSRNESTATRA